MQIQLSLGKGLEKNSVRMTWSDWKWLLSYVIWLLKLKLKVKGNLYWQMLCSKASVDGAAVSLKLRAVSQPLIMFTYSTIMYT